MWYEIHVMDRATSLQRRQQHESVLYYDIGYYYYCTQEDRSAVLTYYLLSTVCNIHIHNGRHCSLNLHQERKA